MIRIATVLAATLIAGQAMALTCLPPDAARLFTWANEAEESYMAVRGTFTPEPRRPPKVVKGDQGYTEWQGRLVGRSLGPRGFSLPYDTEITLRGECIGPWCVAEPPEGVMLALVELTEAGPVLTTDSCSRSILRAPTRDDIRTILRCQKGGACAPAG